mgnify:CR=1
MKTSLMEIPGIEPEHQTVWRVRVLAIDDKAPALAALIRWEKTYIKEYKSIMKVLRLAGQQQRVKNPKHVKKTNNPKHGEVYEAIAYTGIARLMFFYDDRTEALIICTNEYEKGGGNQDAAFARCAQLKQVYLDNIP